MRGTIALGVITVLFAIAAAVWTPLVLPKLELLPTDFNTEVDVSGSVKVEAAPGSLARLPQPLDQPLSASLVIKSVTSSGDNVVLNQVETQKVPPTPDLVLNSQYVIDRHTTQNVNDPQAWSISPNHQANRAPAYSFTLGFTFDPGATYPFWDDSIAASYPLKQAANPGTVNAQGLAAVTLMSGSTTNAPADPVWIAALTPMQLPKSLTVEQWKAAGFEVTSTDPQVAANYFVSIQTQLVIDDLTGGTVSLNQQTLSISVAPAGATAAPQTVLTNSYAETAPSIAKDVALINDNGSKLTLAKTTIPRVLIGLAVLFGLATIAVFVIGRVRSNRAADASET